MAQFNYTSCRSKDLEKELVALASLLGLPPRSLIIGLELFGYSLEQEIPEFCNLPNSKKLKRQRVS